jgi:hypothetical protein
MKEDNSSILGVILSDDAGRANALDTNVKKHIPLKTVESVIFNIPQTSPCLPSDANCDDDDSEDDDSDDDAGNDTGNGDAGDNEEENSGCC